MLDLFDRTVDGATDVSFSEYGCGPHAPFAAEVRKTGTRQVLCFDRKDWGGGNLIANFNTGDAKLKDTTVGVLSGVLEYVNDVDRLFAALKRHHDYILLSYAYLPLRAGGSDKAYAEAVHTRIAKDGWRNHMDIPGLVEKIQKIGFVEAVGSWDGHQIIFVVNCRQE